MYLSNGCANGEFYGRSEGPRQPDPLPDFSKMETTAAFFRAESNSGRDI